MQECETGTGKDVDVKRVTVRSGGAGHAHSGVTKTDTPRRTNGAKAPKTANSKIVRLGS